MKYIKHIILTAMAVLLVAGPVWAMQLYVITPSGQVTLEFEPSDSFENIKAKIEDKTGFDPTYQHLYYNNIECYNDQTLYQVGITSGGQTLTMTYDQPYKDGNTWVFTMPAANKLLEVENYNTYTLTLSHNAGHGTVELLRPGSSAAVGTDENAFQYCYDCQRIPAYPTVANNDNNKLFDFSAPYVGLAGIGYGYTNSSTGPWKLEYVGQYSHSEYNFSVSGVRHTYGLNSDEDVPIFLLYQWSNTTNQYEPVVYGVACAYSKLNNTHGDDHTLLFVAEGHWGCFLSNNQHSQDLYIDFDEDLSMGMDVFAEAATPALPDGVVDNHNGTYSVAPGTTVTIEAIANTAEHYYFNNWTNEDGDVYTEGVVTPSGAKPATSLLTFTVTGDTTVRGNFNIDTYTLRVKPNSINMGHVSIGETVYTSEYKDTVMTDRQHIDVTAIPEPGHYFVNWTNIHGDTVSTSITLNYQATSDTTFTANFAKYAFLEVASNNTDWGTVGKPQVGAGDANHVMTLYDESESTSNHMVPAFTCWFDALTKSQYVIPASKMADAKGGTISSIQYYTQDPVSWTSGAVDVYLKEVNYSTLSSMADKDTCTVVYQGQLTFENKGVTITFTHPYTYNGGNLLVGLENQQAVSGGYNCGIQFLGEDAPGASMSGFDDNYQQQDFLPQCTFTYQPAGAKEADGGYYVILGSVVTVTATPKTDYHFVKWTDEDDNVMGTDAQLTFTITGDTTAMANFQSNSATTYTLKLATNDPAMGTVKIDSAGGSGEKTIIDYNSIESDSCSPCKVCWPGEGSDNLFDGNTSSGKWATDSTVKFVVFHTKDTPVQVNGYTLFTGNDNASQHGRNPKSWVLKAKLASTDSWTTVATVTNDETMQDVNYTPFDFEMDVPGTYQYFRFEVSALRGNGNFMQLGEMQLFNRAISFLDSVSVKDAAANEYYVLPGAKVAVKAIPAAGYQLLKWEDNSTDLHRTVTVTRDTIVAATFGLPTPGVTPEGNLTVFGGRFVSETGEIVATPALTETGELIDESVVPVPVPVIDGVDLSALTDNYVAQDGDTLTGTLNVSQYPVKISIAAGATVTLAGVTINGTNSNDYNWAGITCEGNATIILKDGTENTVKGFDNDCPGIYVPVGSTLTINGGTSGTGKLIASSNGNGAGIGGGWSGSYSSCGNINIQGGDITAYGGYALAGIGGGRSGSCGTINITGGNVTAYGGGDAAGIGGSRGGSCGTIEISGGTVLSNGGQYGAGIGSGAAEFGNASCGNILISGGTITATGGEEAAGIGGGSINGYVNQCGTITITAGVISVTATKGQEAPNSIGAGSGGTCGTVTIEPGANVTQN